MFFFNKYDLQLRNLHDYELFASVEFKNNAGGYELRNDFYAGTILQNTFLK
jgi:hypothetical protein